MSSKIILILIVSSVLSGGIYCATQQQWSSRTIYQIITDRFATSDGSSPACDLNNQPNYCGGTFQGIQNNLDYITGMGFDAIWISPVVANTPNQFHGYAAKNFYEINAHFGTAQDLKNLVNACHNKGVWVIFDIVVNHVGPVGTNFTTISPFNDSSYYHTDCPIGQNDYCTTDDTELNCRLADLPDLNQSVPYVQQTLVSWIQWIVSEFNVDGLRLDTVPYVPTWFWDQFTPASGVFQVGEVECSDCGFVGQFIPHVNGVLGYPLYYALKNAFAYKNSMNGLQSYNQDCITNFPNNAISVMPFADNHDNPRFLSINSDQQQLKAYVTYVLMSIGIPIMYYGTEQGFNGATDPFDREPMWISNYNTDSELYQFVQTVVSVRKSQQIWNYPQVQRYSDDQFYAFTRGNTFVALTNQVSNIERNITYHPYSNGTVLCNQIVSGDCVTVTGGAFQVYLNGGETKIFTIKSSSKSAKFLEE